MSAIIDVQKCTGCGVCVDICPAEAISLTPRGEARIDEGKCTECGSCVHECPNSAIVVVREITPAAASGSFQKGEGEVFREEVENFERRPTLLREVLSALLGTLREGIGYTFGPTDRDRVDVQRRSPASPRRGHRHRRGRRW